MKDIFTFLALIFALTMNAQTNTTPLQRLPFGSIKPTGWLLAQMQKDVAGFVGNLDHLVPMLIYDPIYGNGRLNKNSAIKDLGNQKQGDAEGEEQYKWWNSETQSNWWDAYIRHIVLLDDGQGMEKVRQYIERTLATQDSDGYLGIYQPELRYQFKSENGELWSKTTLYRGLLAYYEATGDKNVWQALLRAVDNVLLNYPIGKSSPFQSGKGFNGGVSHGLTFTDVLDKMYQLTQDKKYLDYAAFLYLDYSNTPQSECDAQLPNILNPDYSLQSHGVHTFEHFRPLLLAAANSDNADLKKAVHIYLDRLKAATTFTGGAVGDEWIAKRTADATETGYEYCSLQELLDSYTLLLSQTGDASIGEAIENIFYNAAQGARNPEHSSIAYLKTDNSYEMLGTKNGQIEADRKQTRYKYSPVHQEIAVCCSPNAGRISPYFVQSSWMKADSQTLVATLLMPNVLQTTFNGTSVRIENQSDYPYQNALRFALRLDKATHLTLKIRKPQWANANIKTREKYTLENDFIVISRFFQPNDVFEIAFETTIKVLEDAKEEKYFTYGALIYAKPIAAKAQKGKSYLDGFDDYEYAPNDTTRTVYQFWGDHNAVLQDGSIVATLRNGRTQQLETVTLIPMGKTILRQCSFK
jgi:uncharacterized protein